MSILPELERQLLEAARRQRTRSAAGGEHATAAARRERRTSRASHSRRLRGSGRRLLVGARRLPVLALAVGALFATTAIALAASGAFPIGSPAPEKGRHAARAGVGVPAKGGSRLLAIRAPDPEGGSPWGLRLVRTTRGELCIQLGRVEHGKLGQLGIDGAFKDDGTFHPIAATNLPSYEQRLGTFAETTHTTCVLAGRAIAATDIGIARSGALDRQSTREQKPRPSGQLRDVYYGVLGPQAVSVSYRAGSAVRTLPVERGTGAYLLVLAAASAAGESGGYALGTYGDLAPSSGSPLTAITYDLGGRVCERVASAPPGSRALAGDRCPFPHWRSQPAVPVDLHRPLHVSLEVSGHVVRSAKVRFTAPYAVSSARTEYNVQMPVCGGHGRKVQGYVGTGVNHDVRSGATVTVKLAAPFAQTCGRRAVTVEAVYASQPAGAQTIVGRALVHQPPGTRAQAAAPRRAARRPRGR